MSVDEELLLLTDRLAAVRSQISQLSDAADNLEAAIVAKLSEGPVRDNSGKILAVVKPPGLRFNSSKAEKALEDEMLPEYMGFSAKKLKEYDPDLYESFREVSGNAKVIFNNDDD